jgi:hypothetical protein
MVEVNVGILCASIPGLKALFVKSKSGYGVGSGSGYQWHSRGKSGVLSGRSGAGGSGMRAERGEDYALEGVGRKGAAGKGQNSIAESSTVHSRSSCLS